MLNPPVIDCRDVEDYGPRGAPACDEDCMEQLETVTLPRAKSVRAGMFNDTVAATCGGKSFWLLSWSRSDWAAAVRAKRNGAPRRAPHPSLAKLKVARGQTHG